MLSAVAHPAERVQRHGRHRGLPVVIAVGEPVGQHGARATLDHVEQPRWTTGSEVGDAGGEQRPIDARRVLAGGAQERGLVHPDRAHRPLTGVAEGRVEPGRVLDERRAAIDDLVHLSAYDLTSLAVYDLMS